jgi:hypothetical protein
MRLRAPTQVSSCSFSPRLPACGRYVQPHFDEIQSSIFLAIFRLLVIKKSKKLTAFQSLAIAISLDLISAYASVPSYSSKSSADAVVITDVNSTSLITFIVT